MRYCPDCGNPHECEAQAAGAEKAEVAIEKLRTNRDIEVARINASAGVQVAETEAEHETAHADGVVEGVEAALDAVTGEPPSEAAAVAEGEPIVVEAPAEPEPEMELDAPPPPEVVPTSGGSKGSGWWSGYR